MNFFLLIVKVNKADLICQFDLTEFLNQAE